RRRRLAAERQPRPLVRAVCAARGRRRAICAGAAAAGARAHCVGRGVGARRALFCHGVARQDCQAVGARRRRAAGDAGVPRRRDRRGLCARARGRALCAGRGAGVRPRVCAGGARRRRRRAYAVDAARDRARARALGVCAPSLCLSPVGLGPRADSGANRHAAVLRVRRVQRAHAGGRAARGRGAEPAPAVRLPRGQRAVGARAGGAGRAGVHGRRQCGAAGVHGRAVAPVRGLYADLLCRARDPGVVGLWRAHRAGL
ncbi:hypothetical protein LPJ70_008003, partial [Coemansia sp. RSA 2708]